MHAEEGEHQVQIVAGSYGGHLHADSALQREGQGVEAQAPHSINSLSSTDCLVGFNESKAYSC